MVNWAKLFSTLSNLITQVLLLRQTSITSWETFVVARIMPYHTRLVTVPQISKSPNGPPKFLLLVNHPNSIL